MKPELLCQWIFYRT